MVIDFKNLSTDKSNGIIRICKCIASRVRNIKIKLCDTKVTATTDMFGIFSDCYNLQTLDLSSFDTSNVTDMSRMFYGCNNLKTLDLSSFDTSNVKFMVCMFERCMSLETVKLPKDKRSRQKLIDQLKRDGVQCTII